MEKIINLILSKNWVQFERNRRIIITDVSRRNVCIQTKYFINKRGLLSWPSQNCSDDISGLTYSLNAASVNITF